jgi:beta-N-acetylglucosaminidase
MVAALTAAMCLGSVHVLAGDGPGGDLTAAQQALAQAELQALQAKNRVAGASAQLAAASAELTQAQAQLAAMQTRIDSLDAEVSSDQAQVTSLRGQIAQDRQRLAAFVRASYESQGSQTTVGYLIDARSISDLVARINEIDHVATAGNQLVNQIHAAQTREQHLLSAALEARDQEQAAEQQAATQEVVIANDEASDAVLLADDQVAAGRAEQAVSSAQTEYDLISEYDTEYADAAAALALARADDTIFAPVPGPVFTEDTDLTIPSGENAQTIDGFLAGTDLAGLGSAYMQAEQSYGVSARYLVAHSIEESGWGTSAIAQQKHNLFGYGADDTNPFGDAMSFPSFTACILFVAQEVKQNYLTPTGAYYHGPTLRGMNVDYASDPFWASQIAAIARTVPLPA